MFKNIVWATSGSEAADLCLPLVKTLATESDAEVLVVHCEELTLPGKAGGSFPVHANEDELQAKIRAQAGELSRHDAPVRLERTRARVGGAAQAIAQAAEDSGAT